MCSRKVIDFVRDAVMANRYTHPIRVIEIGSFNVNGEARLAFSTVPVQEYIGTDIRPGPGVDVCLPFHKLIEAYGYESFDVVVCCEVAEHVQQWKTLISVMKMLVRENGLIIFTAPSKGFPKHDYPDDFWRFEVDDVVNIFSDMNFPTVVVEPEGPGVFCYCTKPDNFEEVDLKNYTVGSVE